MLENQNNVNDAHIVGPPFWCGEEGGGWASYQSFKRGLDFCFERGGDFFQGGWSFYMKNKSMKYLMTKEVYKQMFFSVITKKLNWKVLTKNLVTFKRWDRVKGQKLNTTRVHWKIQFLGRRVHEKPIYMGKLPKKEGRVGHFADLRGGGVFEGREGDWYSNAHCGNVLVSLLLPLKWFYSLFWCFYCWLWTSKYRQERR